MNKLTRKQLTSIAAIDCQLQETEEGVWIYILPHQYEYPHSMAEGYGDPEYYLISADLYCYNTPDFWNVTAEIYVESDYVGNIQIDTLHFTLRNRDDQRRMMKEIYHYFDEHQSKSYQTL